MQNNRINRLIKRAEALYSLGKPLTNEEIRTTESSLNVILPNDFKKINLQYSYEYIDFFEFYAFRDEVIEETLGFREICSLPNEYVLLSNENSTDFVFINTKSGEVIWCGLQDVNNLFENKPMTNNPTIFPSFTDFFEFLLDEEEKMQAEDD